ncbi:MAG: hypothetical protein P1U90_07945 [Akkermansiaceae bacterium]|nr:hypothetical protein [Akkermansiaceae bacterium]
MKILLLLPFLALAAKAMPPAVGSITQVIPFERFTDSGVANSGITDHEGKIIIVTYYTPW